MLQSVSQNHQSLKRALLDTTDLDQESHRLSSLPRSFSRRRQSRSAAYRRAEQVFIASSNADINYVGGMKEALLVGFWIGNAWYVDSDAEEQVIDQAAD